MMSHFSAFLFILLAGSGLCNPQYQPGNGQISNPGGNQCGHPHYACVPYFQCKNGEIITDGGGLIDVRITPQGNCIDPEYPDVPGLCCLIPGSAATPPPAVECPLYTTCVDYNQCGADGYIITDGSGLLDLRTIHTSCWLKAGVGGACCKEPPVHISTCPIGSVCVLGSDCRGQAYDASSQFIDYISLGAWSLCPYGNDFGVCCQQPVRDVCPGSSICVAHHDCFGTALDIFDSFVDYTSAGTWDHCSAYDQGVCCLLPPPRDVCPGDSICLPHNECLGTALGRSGSFVDYVSTGNWDSCSAYDQGVCCINPYIGPPVAQKCGVRNVHFDSRIDPKIASKAYDEHREATFGEFPWQCIIFHQNYTYICGASLISDKHILTAAHCVDYLAPGDIRIRCGEWQVNTFDEALAYEDYNVHNIIIHADYNPKNVHNDVAVMELVNPVAYQYHINSVCLPKHDTVIGDTPRCIATGWGKDSFTGAYQHIMKKIDLPVIQHSYCQDLLRKTRLGKFFRLDDSFMCAGGEENEDACSGDGGGPLVCEDLITGQYVQVGITSWGIGCGQLNVPGVYADVTKFASWINQAMFGPTPVQSYAGK